MLRAKDSLNADSLVVSASLRIHLTKESNMLYWALAFFLIAIVAALLGFGGIAGGAMGIAKILFFVFLILFLVSLIMGLARRGSAA